MSFPTLTTHMFDNIELQHKDFLSQESALAELRVAMLFFHQTFDLSQVIACDTDGKPIKHPEASDYMDQPNGPADYNKASTAYCDAFDKVLFSGWELSEEIFFENGEERIPVGYILKKGESELRFSYWSECMLSYKLEFWSGGESSENGTSDYDCAIIEGTVELRKSFTVDSFVNLVKSLVNQDSEILEPTTSAEQVLNIEKETEV